MKPIAPVLVFKLLSPNSLSKRVGVDNKHHYLIFMESSSSANTSADMFSGGTNSIRSSSQSNLFQWPKTSLSPNDNYPREAVARSAWEGMGAFGHPPPSQVPRGQPYSLPPLFSPESSFLQGIEQAEVKLLGH